jgi:hypothetical protein
MQTWITDYSFMQSAKNLDRQRLGAQIYEGIHILASLIGLNDKLVNPKRDVSNYPQAKLWKGWEGDLYLYILCHLIEWEKRGHKAEISNKNIAMISWEKKMVIAPQYVPWITPELIIVHRSVLIQKKPEHYKPLWPNCPDNLKMRYDWREK